MKRNRRPGLRKEKVIMLAASLFVLSALTMTGVYVREKDKSDQDGYVVDLNEMEKQAGKKAEEIKQAKAGDLSAAMDAPQLSNDMDVDPDYQEANSGNVKNQADSTIQIPGVGNVKVQPGERLPVAGDTEAGNEEVAVLPEDGEEAVEVSAEAAPAIAYQFDEGQMLQWPVMGNVILNYSMDKTIFFPSLEQYKYNPSIIIAAKLGDPVKAAVKGEVTNVFTNAEIGNAITVNLGNGYEATYGQLDNIQAAVGENLEAGEVIGYVAAPTKYYSVEGSNIYFSLEKAGVPINPLNQLQ